MTAPEPPRTPTRATPDEAELLAKRACVDYINACALDQREQMPDYLMKLCSVAGILMAHSAGSEDAALRLEGTAAFIRKSMPKQPAKLERLQ